MTGEPRYQSVIDVPGVVGQFLLNTTADDLVIELIQNELDARSAWTRVQILDDRLVCEGEGRPIKTDGWDRLKSILGAGGDVRAKRDGIGAKNHGLRVGFWIGDVIRVQSNGRCTQLTTRCDPSKSRFDPGAWVQPTDDPNAPPKGTRISIPFRQHVLSPVGIEGLELSVSDSASVDRIMIDMLRNAPQRLVGVTHPTELPRYTLDLIPAAMPPVRFVFTCRNVGRATGLPMLERTVRRVEGDTSSLIAREHAVRFSLKTLKGDPKVSWFFKGAKGAEGEVSWEIAPSGKPKSVLGTLRYPIAYLAESGATTGYGLHVSAPFVSDQSRHAPASGGETNPEIIQRCDEVIARIIAHYLVPKFGPAVLDIMRAAGSSTSRTNGLLKAIGDLGGLPVTVNTSRARRKTSQRRITPWRTARGPILVPYSHNTLTTRLLQQLVPYGQKQLHPDTPSFVVEALSSGSFSNLIVPYGASDVIDRLCAVSTRFPWHSDAHRVAEFSQPDRMLLYLGVLGNETLLLRQRASSIKQRGELPVSGGGSAPWCTVSLADSDPPKIPGVGDHKIIHPGLRNHPLLRAGLLEISRFNVEDRLRILDWNGVANSAKEKYLTWLARNAGKLRTETLRVIASHPIFQASDGSFHSFDTLCLVQNAWLAGALEQHIRSPSPKTLALVRAKPSAFKIRAIPNISEVKSWYFALSAELGNQDPSAPTPETLKLLDHMESTMERLVALDHALSDDMRLWGHRTITRSGHLRKVDEIHVPTDAVDRCALSNYDLVKNASSRLWGHLGIQGQPSPDAILRVIADDAESDTFFRRLSAYLANGGDPVALATCACIHTKVGRKIPSEVALRARASYWGQWKTTIEVKIPERVRNLRQVGVLAAELQEDDSRAFFSWLSSQDDRTVLDHLVEIERHWHERRAGPLRWWHLYQDIPCLPVIAGGKLLLVSHRQSGARPVYLPDFPAIKQQFADGESRSGVVHEGIVREFPELRKSGVLSLREFLVGRGQISPISPGGEVETRHHETIRYVQMAASGRRLIEELSRLGVSRSKLRMDFLQTMGQLSNVRKAEKIIVRYRVGSRTYETVTNAGLDDFNTLWLTNDASDIAPLEALAEHLFRAGEDADTAPYKLFQAVQAVRASYGKLVITPVTVSRPPIDSLTKGMSDPSGAGQSSDDGPHTPASGHTPPKFESQPVPNPTPFPPARPQDFVESGRVSRSTSPSVVRPSVRGPSSERRNTVLEEMEKTQLKRDNYAYHCQACLGLYQPSHLTPKFSYMWDRNYRNQNIEAHHVAHIQNEGALGAGNLLILCEYHHDFLGDKLDRDEITGKLEKAGRETRRFPADVEGSEKKSIIGRVVTLELDVAPYIASLFFTDEHAKVWLDRAKANPEEGGLDEVAE